MEEVLKLEKITQEFDEEFSVNIIFSKNGKEFKELGAYFYEDGSFYEFEQNL